MPRKEPFQYCCCRGSAVLRRLYPADILHPVHRSSHSGDLLPVVPAGHLQRCAVRALFCLPPQGDKDLRPAPAGRVGRPSPGHLDLLQPRTPADEQ